MSERNGENRDVTENPDPESEGGAARCDNDDVNETRETEQQSEDPEDIDCSNRNDARDQVNDVTGPEGWSDNPDEHHVVNGCAEAGDLAHEVCLQSEHPEDSDLGFVMSPPDGASGHNLYWQSDPRGQSEHPEGLMPLSVPLHNDQSEEPEDSTESIRFYTEASSNNSLGVVSGLEDDSTEDDKGGASVQVIQPEHEAQILRSIHVGGADVSPEIVLDSPTSDGSNLDIHPEVERTEDDPDRVDLRPQNEHAEDEAEDQISRCMAMGSGPLVVDVQSNLTTDCTEADGQDCGSCVEGGDRGSSSDGGSESRLETESHGCAIACNVPVDVDREGAVFQNNAVEADSEDCKAQSESDPEENTGSPDLSNDRIEADNSENISAHSETESTHRLGARIGNNSDYQTFNGDIAGGVEPVMMDLGVCSNSACEEAEGASANTGDIIQCNLSGRVEDNLQVVIGEGEHINNAHLNGDGLLVGAQPLGDIRHGRGGLDTGELEDQPEDSGFSRRGGERRGDNVTEADLYAPECDRGQNCLEQTDKDDEIQGANSSPVHSMENLPDLVMADVNHGNAADSMHVLPSCEPSAEALSMQNLNLFSDHLCSGDVGDSLSEDFERSADVLQPDVLQQQHVNVQCDSSEEILEPSSSNEFTNMEVVPQSDLVAVHTCNDIEGVGSNMNSNTTGSNQMLNNAGQISPNGKPVHTSSAAVSHGLSHGGLGQSEDHPSCSNTDSTTGTNSNLNNSLQSLPCSLSGSAGTQNESETNSTETAHSTLAACSGNIAEDEDLLNELDAELHIINTKETNHLDRGDHSSVVVPDRVTVGTGDGLINGLCASSASCLADVKLKQQIYQLLKRLADKDAKIERLTDEQSSQKEQLEFVVHEKDTYLKKLQILQSKQSPDDLYLPQIKELEYSLAQQQNEIRGLKEKLSSHDAAAKRAVGALQHELKLRVDQVTKMYEDCRKEKDSMVVKYAQAEHKNIELQKNTEAAEGKLRDILKEREQFLVKARALKADYTRTSAELESKNAEWSAKSRELDKQRELLASAEVRIKWAQNKMKAELESHKETKKELEKSVAKIKESKEEAEQIRRDCQAIIKTYQESEEMKSSTLDQRLRRKESELVLEKREKTDQEEVHSVVLRELESLKVKHKDTLEELKTYKDKVRAQEAERLTNEHSMAKYKEIMQSQKRENKDLQSKIDKLFHTQTDFDRAQDTIKSIDADIRDLKLSNKELQAEIESCRKRETDLLELTEKLTGKNANLQSENTSLNGKVLTLTGDHQRMMMEIQEFETKLKHTSDSLEEEKKARRTETDKLREALNEKIKSAEGTSTLVDELRDDIKTLKRKHANNIKDLTRQLQQARKRLDSMDSHGENKESVSMGSRTSSNGSLNAIQGENNSPSVTNSTVRQTTPESPPQEYPVIVDQVEIDRQVLIERIVKLQKAHARKNEKIEFMEDHIKQLVVEVKKKKKIIQSYVMREESGALSTEYMDKNKAELSKKGGIMASVYSSHAADGHMSLDLSLEINRKLQAVLEDTLLKNITLKENIDTLGEEIARLSQENRRLQLSIQGQNGS